MVHYLRAKLVPLQPGTLPFAYREQLQGLIYRLLPESLSRWLHEEGLATPQGRWKPFVFSRIVGKLQPDTSTKTFQVTGPIYFRLASPLSEIVQELGTALMLKHRVNLGGLELYHEELLMTEVIPPPAPVTLVARSPITAYRKEDGRRRYFRPEEPAFAELLVRNLRMKAEALGKNPEGEVRIEPVGITPRHKKIERFHRLVVEGWMGRYRLTAPPELTWVALTSGLGALGSQGFGFVEAQGD